MLAAVLTTFLSPGTNCARSLTSLSSAEEAKESSAEAAATTGVEAEGEVERTRR